MNIAVKKSLLNEHTLFLAVTCSMMLHILFFVVMPNLKFDVIKKLPDVLKVELVQPKKPDPVVADSPKPAPPKPDAAMPIEKTKPLPKPVRPPPTPLPKSQLAPIEESKPQAAQADPPTPSVIAAAPTPESSPVFTAPPPDQPIIKLDNDDAYNAAKSSYRSSVQKEIQRNLRYPKIAQKHRVTGLAKVEIVMDAEGNISAVNIASSSGSDSLDAEALAVISRSNLKQYMNKMLSGKIDRIIIPVSFTLPEE